MNTSTFHGRINDLDSHLMVPARRYGELLGEIGERLASRMTSPGANENLKKFFDPDHEEPHSPENVWKIKGVAAPGAATAEGRLQTLDIMGIDKQIVFPQVFVCNLAWADSDEAMTAMQTYNDFAIEWTRAGKGRLRPCTVLNLRDIDAACEEAERVIKGGARAVFIPDGLPPGNKSPAAPEMDRFWAILAEGKVPALLHIGGQADFMASRAWGDIPQLKSKGLGAGEAVNPHLMVTVHMSPQNYISTMIMGGVFERHPELRFGAIELGAHWVGPMAETMDEMFEQRFSSGVREILTMKPSEYLRRNVRVTPYLHQDIGLMIDRYGLEDVYAFSTDFPHPEGGTDPIHRMSSTLDGHGVSILEKFLVGNAEWILPD